MLNVSALIIELEDQGCTVIPTADSNTLLVNGSPTLVRTSLSDNTDVPIELLRCNQQRTWVKSWGLTSHCRWLLHVDDEAHHWYRLDLLRMDALEGKLKNNAGQSNVVVRWVPKLQSTYSHYRAHDNGKYSTFLAGVNNV
jgi:hypothetical protein